MFPNWKLLPNDKDDVSGLPDVKGRGEGFCIPCIPQLVGEDLVVYQEFIDYYLWRCVYPLFVYSEWFVVYPLILGVFHMKL